MYIMINKLFAYGCSFTYGDSLGVPTQEAWPYKLGEMLGIEVVNRGVNGGSNKLASNKLFEDITQNAYSEILVVFSWTGIQRTTFYSEEKEQWVPCLIGHDSPDTEIANMTKYYYKYFYNDYEALYTYYTQILGVQSFLDKLNIKYLFINAFKEDFVFYDDNIFGSFREFINKNKFVFGYENNIYNEICLKRGKLAKDGFHPNKEGHEMIANEIYNSYMLENGNTHD